MALVNYTVRISNLNGVSAYKFRYEDFDIHIENNEGNFSDQESSDGRLKWWMLGNPGGTMKVEVFRGGASYRKRNNSTIPNSKPAGFDWMKIKTEAGQ